MAKSSRSNGMLTSKRASRLCSWGCCGRPPAASVLRRREKRQWQREAAA